VQAVAVTAQPTQALQTPESISLTQSNIVFKGEPPDFGDGKVSIPQTPGDYLVYWNKKGFVRYASLDGTIKGNLIEGYLINEHAPVVILPGKKTSQFIFTTKHQEYTTIGNTSIWMTDIFENLLETWKVEANSEFGCFDPVFSPYGYWMAIDCYSATAYSSSGRYINLVNLESGKASVLNIKCDLGPTPGPWTSSKNFNWSHNETEFSYRCPFGEYYFISISGDNVVARQLGDSSGNLRVWSVSPDWKKIVLDMGYMPKNADGTTSGLRVFIADLDCVLNNPNCAQGETFDLPFALPIDQATRAWADLQMYWNKAGDGIAWMSSSYTYDNKGSFSTRYHSSGWIDLSTNTNQMFERQLHGSTEFLGISPDGEWMLFSGYTDPYPFPRTLYVVSLKDGTIRHLAESDKDNAVDIINFYGWLTIP